METWDLYDEDRRPLGRTVPREKMNTIRPGEYYLVAEIWTVGKGGRILLTRRDLQKKHGGLWENTGGAVTAGEDSVNGAMRELREETGLRATRETLHPISSWREERAFFDSFGFYAQTDEIILQPGETIDYAWVTMERLVEMIESGLIAPPIAKRFRVDEAAIRAFVGART